jgi:hypothetical protein
MDVDDSVKQAQQLVKACRPLFAGKPPPVQGAALADMLAIWLASHVVPGDEAATIAVRAELLERHLETVAALIPINYAQSVEPQLPKAQRQ